MSPVTKIAGLATSAFAFEVDLAVELEDSF